MKTTQNEFHSMRGHVSDGCTIMMNNGDTVILKAVMQGWQLFVQDGKPHSLPTNSAHVIECLVYSYPSEEI